ncbi:hypothetical protein [Arcobacter sp. LA11]|uniref:hypothetical protein n=1 Tax=Arcobacter sp. LA11 TaxID=1898176 RepID=UPI000934877A|nr:hypothetical protein [Arcobacter sp. LA11]
MNQKVLVFLYRESVGELNVSLPIIKKLFKEMDIKNIYFHFISKDKYLKVDSTYKKIIKEFGTISIGNLDFLNLLYKLLDKNITVISSDFCPVFELNQIRSFFPNTTTILMHHAQSILYKEKNIESIYKLDSKNKIYNPDFFLVGNKIDYENKYFTTNNYNIDSKKILFIGALNYEKEWIDYLLTNEKSEDNSITEKVKEFEKVILVTTRAPHKQYMMEEDYNYQVNSILQISDIFPNFLFIIKPHPREKMKIYKKAFSDSKKSSNVLISNQNTYKLCSYSDLVISFWSSVIQDCAVTNTPVIEFHRHSQKNEKLLIWNKDKLQSFFEYYGFCSYTDNKKNLIKFISEEENKNLLDNQIKNIKKIFIPMRNEIEETLTKITDFNKIKNKKLTKINKLNVTVKFIRNLISLYINKKLKKLR